ncbi:MAG TPA: proton-conducting transporter membrane subunit, partial [Cellvibrionaceae bacterium]|nr:proton-conducting transporter membrane subunit [Cellvibrionaceae bacterium]
GGLRKKIPFVYACFVVGGAALAALPFVTAGFYSKDEILWQAFTTDHKELFYAGVVGAFFTSIYTFRLIFIVFHGKENTHAHAIHGADYWLPLGILLVLSTFVGALIHPPLAGVLPASAEGDEHAKHTVEMISGAIALAGVAIAWFLFIGERKLVSALANSAPGKLLSKLWYSAWGFDFLYDLFLVKPYNLISRALRIDPLDKSFWLIPALVGSAHLGLSAVQTGKLRWYATTIVIGAVVVMATLVFL